ncbi:lysosome membrane protein 2-like [Schistocerca americana]|uniref:lysosome membrane protein 2-like n=1 Tax=Schistocerca americana TaxID=7009 RepID=UPI001F4FD112|nr:lysosome membrane protein 2-like [Schistocerca americana]
MSENHITADGVKYSPVRKSADDEMKEPSRCSPAALYAVAAVLSLLTAGFVVGSVVMWGTNVFEDAVLQNLVIRNDTQTFQWWVDPPVQPLVRVYIFNYSNAVEFEAGNAEKLRVNEVGPFAFRQHLHKVNVAFTNNGTVRYQDDASFTFVPELSVGGLNTTKLRLINMPLVSAISMLRKSSYWTQIGVKAVMAKSPFLHLDVEEFLWGYQEALMTLSSIFSMFGLSPSDMRLGFLEARSGIGRSMIEAETGARDMKQLGIIVSVDGEPRLRAWGDTECSRVDGTDGSMFPPHLVEQHAPLYLFNKELCRRLPLEFEKDLMVNDIPARRYRPPRNVFARGDVNPENACFCQSDECPPGGVFNASPCAFGAPIMVSLPHFHLGDKELLEAIEGMNPDPEKHDIYLDIHPTLGVVMRGKTSLQFNVRVEKSKVLTQLDRFSEGMILPIAWMEVAMNELPPDLHSILYSATHTVNLARQILRWGLLALAVLCFVILSCTLHKYRSEMCSTRRTESKDHVLKPL